MSHQASVLRKTGVFLDLIRFEHTVFALPFAYSGMLLAAGGHPTLAQFLWITLAMTAARTSAMALNRFADRHLDARNPRTADRPIQQGRIGADWVLLFAFLSLFLLGLAAYNLNPLVFRLWPLAVVFLVGYSYTKRFTWLCHWVLGITDSLAPLGAWAAISGSLLTAEDLPGWFLAAGVAFWISGFDILYALQDIQVDRREGLFSVPARFGAGKGIGVARICHVAAAAAFAAGAVAADLSWPFWLGWAAVCGLFVYEHKLVRPDDLSRLDIAFFNVNSYISLALFAAIAAGLYA